MKNLLRLLPMFYLLWHLGAFNSYDEWYKYFDTRIAPKKNVKSVDVRIVGVNEQVMVIWSEEVAN